MGYFDLAEKAESLSTEERMLLLYRILESLNVDVEEFLNSNQKDIIVTPCVLIKVLMMIEKFIPLSERLYSVEERSNAKDEIDNSTSLILR